MPSTPVSSGTSPISHSTHPAVAPIAGPRRWWSFWTYWCCLRTSLWTRQNGSTCPSSGWILRCASRRNDPSRMVRLWASTFVLQSVQWESAWSATGQFPSWEWVIWLLGWTRRAVCLFRTEWGTPRATVCRGNCATAVQCVWVGLRAWVLPAR